MKLTTKRGPPPIDAGPKMTLEDAAERCKVDVHWLRKFVVRAGLKPCARYTFPSRYYYSLTQIRNALRAERKGETH